MMATVREDGGHFSVVQPRVRPAPCSLPQHLFWVIDGGAWSLVEWLLLQEEAQVQCVRLDKW